MKNKLYYVLFLVYVAVVMVVLYINGAFAGNITDLVNFGINGGFLIIIGILFLISMISFGRLNRFTDELMAAAEKIQKEYMDAGGRSLWTNYQDKKDLFKMEVLKNAYAKYRMRMRSFRTKRGYVNSCDLEEYINEDLIDRTGFSFFNSGMPGALTGLGILGTFLGLSIGLGSFNGNDIYAVTDNVGTLLGGMKVAFHTSVYGIFFSLVFSFVYRSIMADAYEKLDAFLDVFRQCVVAPTINEDESYAAMLVYQANMSNSVKQMLELMQGTAKEQVAGVERIVNQFMEQMSLAMGSNLRQLGNTLQTTSEAQRVYADNCKSLTEATAALIEMNKENQKTWQVVLEKQELLAGQLDEQKQKLEATCDEISMDISNQLYTFEQMRNAYEK